MKKQIFALVIGIFSISASSAFAQTSPAKWKHTYVAGNGKTWSNILKGKFANCISEKNEDGSVKLGADGNAICRKDAKGFLLGLSADHSIITDSDAVRACENAGGRLPEKSDFEALGDAYKKMSNMTGNMFWSSTVVSSAPNSADGAYMYFGYFGELGKFGPQIAAAVRCVNY